MPSLCPLLEGPFYESPEGMRQRRPSHSPRNVVQDLVALQELLLQKAGTKQSEESMLVDVANLVAQRRWDVGDNGSGEGNSMGDSIAEDGNGGAGPEGAAASSPRSPRLKKFEHTGWFHTYE